MNEQFEYKGRNVEIYGPIYGGFGFCITSANGCEYRERSFVTAEQATIHARFLIDRDDYEKWKNAVHKMQAIEFKREGWR